MPHLAARDGGDLEPAVDARRRDRADRADRAGGSPNFVQPPSMRRMLW
ncbi:hypothetical protein [Streptomyces sp. NPDC012888]